MKSKISLPQGSPTDSVRWSLLLGYRNYIMHFCLFPFHYTNWMAIFWKFTCWIYYVHDSSRRAIKEAKFYIYITSQHHFTTYTNIQGFQKPPPPLHHLQMFLNANHDRQHLFWQLENVHLLPKV